MAVSAANLTSGVDADGNSSSTTASISPTGNRLILATVVSRTGITANPNQPTLSGNGLTWVAIGSVIHDDAGSTRRRVTLFRAMVASPSAGAVTIDFGGQNQTNVVWVIDECAGVDTSGTNGSGAVVQSATNVDTSGTGTTLTVTLAAFGSADNATYGAFGDTDATVVTTAGTGFAIVGEETTSTAVGATTEFLVSNDTTVNMTWASGLQLGGIAVEIKAAAEAGVTIRPQKTLLGVGV